MADKVHTADEEDVPGKRPEGPSGPGEPSRPGDPSRLGTGSVGRLLVEFSIPSIVAMLFNALYNIVDTVFLQIAVPSVGAAVTQLAYPVQAVLMGFSMLAGIGGNALAAIELGRGDRDAVERILANTAELLVGLGVLTAVVGVALIDPVLALLGTTPELWEPTGTFVRIVCVGFVLQSLGMGLNNFLRTAGRPNLALGTSVLGTAACAALNAALVLGAGWGVAGSACATVAGQGIGALPVLWFFACSDKAPFRLRASRMRPAPRLMGSILAMGLASFAMQVAGSVTSAVLNHVVGVWAVGEAVGVTGALAAISISWKALNLVYTVVIGVTAGAQPILGFNVGARQWGRVLDTLRLGCLFAVGLATLGWAFFELAPGVVLAAFSVDDGLLPFASSTLRTFGLLLPLAAFQMMGSSYFQSSGQPLKSTVLELTRQVIFLIPLYLVFPHVAAEVLGIGGLAGVVACVPVADALATALTAVFVGREVRRLRGLQREGREGRGMPEQLQP